MARTVDTATRNVLARSTIDGRTVRLPGQLERAEYVRVDKVLRGIGGRWDRKAKGHVFDFDPAELLAGAANDGRYVDRKQELQFFETPIALAERMADLAEIVVERAICPAGPAVLEPSCGRGRLVRPLLARGADITALDIDPAHVEACKALGLLRDGIVVDFLAWAPKYRWTFDAVVMNPPFTRGQDVRHIQAAWSLLARGGRLVAICSEGPFFRQSQADQEFLVWLAGINADVEKLPPATFRESGTAVATRLITARKT